MDHGPNTPLKSSSQASSTHPNGQASIALDLFNFDHNSNFPLQLEIPSFSFSIDSPSTIPSASKPTAAALAPQPTVPSSPSVIDLPPNNNSIQFPSTQSFSSASSQSSSAYSSASPSTTSLLHSFTAPIPTLRHSSASLFEPHNSHHHARPTQRTHHRTLASPQIHAYLTNPSLSQQSSPQPLSPKSPNSIKFPSTSPTANTFTFIATSVQNGPNPLDSLDRLIKHWLTSTFAPDPINSQADRSPVPELDILVGFKSITDQLNLPPLDRDQAWSALCHVFPTARSWARPTPAGLRSNKEFVVTGIKLKRDEELEEGQKPQAVNDLTRPHEILTSKTNPNRDAQLRQPFRQLDFNQPIPEEAHSKELVEYMRKRICALELQSQLQDAKISSNRRKLIKYPNPKNADQLGFHLKKQHNPPPRLFRFDHALQPSNSGRLEKDRVRLLGERIWLSIIKACQHTKDNFLNGETLTASWTELMNKFEFDLIVKNSKSHQNRTTETSSQQFVRIIYPFQKSNHIKLFKSQPIDDFNSAVFNQDRRTNLVLHQPNRKVSDDSILKDFRIIQITPSSVSTRQGFEPDRENSFATISKRNLTKATSPNNQHGCGTTIGQDKQKPRGKSLDLLSNPTALLIKQQRREAEKEFKEGSSIGVLFETLNLNFRAQRKSLNLDKLFANHQTNNHPSRPAKRSLADTLEPPYSPRPFQSNLVVKEMLIEFNLSFLNRLKFQIQLFKEEA